jgi:hypothetical protein
MIDSSMIFRPLNMSLASAEGDQTQHSYLIFTPSSLTV